MSESSVPIEYVSVREVVRRLSGQVSRSWVYDLVKSGKLRGTRVGSRVLIEEESLNAMLAAGRVAAITHRRPRPKAAALPGKFKHFGLAT